MSVPTVQSSSFQIFGPPDEDGSRFVRNTLTISDGTTQNFDQPNLPSSVDPVANLNLIVSNVNAYLAAVNSSSALLSQAASDTAQGNALLAQASTLTAQANALGQAQVI